jgi:signal peptidase I
MKATKNDWIKFSVWGSLYVLLSVWVGNLWLLLGLPVVFDMYVSKKVPWSFYKKTKDGKKPHWIIEWLDAIIFALVAVGLINIYLFQNYKIPTSSLEKTLLVGDHLFVSKVAFGPRNPMTPLSFPLAQHTLPLINSKSYIEKPQWEYKRLVGFGKVERDDIVVFNFPTGDTVCVNVPNPDYYALCRSYGRDRVWKNNVPGIDFGEIVWRPVDRRENYVKRCVALPGDTLVIKHGKIYVNSQPQKPHLGIQYNYFVTTNGTRINPKVLETMKIAKEDINSNGNFTVYYLPLTDANVEEMKKLPNVVSVTLHEEQPGEGDANCFPFKRDLGWNGDNYGPLYIPKKGATVALNMETLPFYSRIIEAYEHNTLTIKSDSTILLNGQPADTYTFKLDYYFMMGDNRDMSADSRYWGYVPEDHIVGKPILVWLSLDKDKKFPANIRWNRFFKWVGKK